MNEQKSKLLRGLTIRRVDDIPPPRRRRWGLALAIVLVAFAAGGGLWSTASRIPLKSPGGEVASSPPSPPLATTPAVSEPRRAGSLVASGYVVARRKATIAAEITGKVVEVFVDEGNVVEAGQIVARLDSVLAEKDLALSRSRADAAEAATGAIAADLRDAERIMRLPKLCRRRTSRARRISQRPRPKSTSCARNCARRKRNCVQRASMRNAMRTCSTSIASARRSQAWPRPSTASNQFIIPKNRPPAPTRRTPRRIAKRRDQKGRSVPGRPFLATIDARASASAQINGRAGLSFKSYPAISASRLRLRIWKILFFQRITFNSESFRKVLLAWTSDIPSVSATCCWKKGNWILSPSANPRFSARLNKCNSK